MNENNQILQYLKRFLNISLLFLIVLFLGIKIYKNGFNFIWGLLINIIKCFAFIFVLIGLHELSHALMAMILKFCVTNIKILFIEFDLSNKQVKFSLNLDLGYCKAYPISSDKNVFYKYIFHIAIGPIVNLMVCISTIFIIMTIDHKTLSDYLLILISVSVLLEFLFFIPQKDASDFSDLQMIYLLIKKDRRAIHFYETCLFQGLNSIGTRPKDFPDEIISTDLQGMNYCEIPYYLYISYKYFDLKEYKKAYDIINFLKDNFQLNNIEFLSFGYILSYVLNKDENHWIPNDLNESANSIETLVMRYLIQIDNKEKKHILKTIENYYKEHNDGIDQMFHVFIFQVLDINLKGYKL